MDTTKMVAEIKSACSVLEKKKADLTERIRVIDDELTAYRMAIDALELTVSGRPAASNADGDKPIGKIDEKIGRRTVLTFKGKSQTLVKWAKELGMTPEGMIYRLSHGHSVEDTISKPKTSYKHSKPRKVFAYDCHGNVIRQYVGVGDASKDLNLPVSTIEKIIDRMSRDDQLRVRNYYLAYAG